MGGKDCVAISLHQTGKAAFPHIAERALNLRSAINTLHIVRYIHISRGCLKEIYSITTKRFTFLVRQSPESDGIRVETWKMASTVEVA